MKKIESEPPVVLGSPEVDWGFLSPNQHLSNCFYVQGQEIEPTNDKKPPLPEELREVLGAIDEDFRALNGLDKASRTKHELSVRSGNETSANLFTSVIPQMFKFNPPRVQLAGAFHLDIVLGDEQSPMSYAVSTLDATEFMLGDFYVAGNRFKNIFGVLGGLMGNFALIKAQKGLVLQPNPGELVRFDPLSSVHRAPYRHHDGTGLDHIFLRDSVSIAPVSEGE